MITQHPLLLLLLPVLIILDLMTMQELVRFNALLSVMSSSLVALGQAIQGLALMSSELDALGRALFDGKVGQLGGEEGQRNRAAPLWDVGATGMSDNHSWQRQSSRRQCAPVSCSGCGKCSRQGTHKPIRIVSSCWLYLLLKRIQHSSIFLYYLFMIVGCLS